MKKESARLRTPLRTVRLVQKNVAKVLRVSSYLAVVAVGLSAVGVRSVHAQTKKAAFAIGEPLGKLDVPPAAGGNLLVVNGQRLHLSAAHVDASVAEVLDRVQQGCVAHADGLADDLGALERDFTKSPVSGRGQPGIAILRDERDGRGVVACFATGESAPTSDTKGLVTRLARFAETSDLADIGGLRYVAVHADGHGSKVVATWSDDPLPLESLFASEGDAPGADPSAAPRPAGARRILSARVEPAAYGVFMYSSAATAQSMLGDYDRAMTSRGFRTVDTQNPLTRSYQSGLIDVVVTATDGKRGEETTLSIVESHYAEARSTVGVTQ